MLNINNQIFFFFYNLSHRSFFFDDVTLFFAHLFPYIVIVLAGIFLLLHHDVLKSENPFKAFAQKWREIVLVFFSGIFAWAISATLKILFHTARPFNALGDVIPLLNPTDFSFPSGHSTFYMALAFAMFFSHKKAGYVFMFFALLIGIARIIAGVHFPIDILGGFGIGILIAYFVNFLYKKMFA